MDGFSTMRTMTHAHDLLSVSTCVWLVFSATAAHAQTASDADREAQRIQREQQEQQRQQIEQQRRKLPAPQGNLDLPAREPSADDGGPCRNVTEVEIGSAP
ncbi:MAG TPA: hypothetical protein VMF89_25725, partial [Polyangiales bacterium]|nr:hypothetical protein [Polyangiales bacterium]